MRPLQLALVAITTFVFTRLIDHLVVPRETSLSSRAALGATQLQPQQAPQRPCPTTEQTAAAMTSRSVTPPAAVSQRTRREPHFAVIGFPVGIDERNRARRDLLRELWYPEYDNLGPEGRVRCEFIIGLLTYQGDGHEESVVTQLHSEHVAHGDLALVNAREATRDPYRGDPKCTGEKILAWFQQVVVVHRGTRFFIKAGAVALQAARRYHYQPIPAIVSPLPCSRADCTPHAHAATCCVRRCHCLTCRRLCCRSDWDSWIHTVRLEVNLQALLAHRSGPLYFGNTLWCSYSIEDFQPCGYGFGPLQAAGSKKTECPLLPHGRRAIGPYPYTAGSSCRVEPALCPRPTHDSGFPDDCPPA